MDNFSKVMKALSDNTRIKIIDLLLQYDFCVGGLARKLEISEASVSQHLQVLRKAGLVTGEKRGYYTHYDLNRNLFEEAAQAIHAIAAYEGPRKECRLNLTGHHQECVHYKAPQGL